jgi:hypothetical protein
MTSSQTRSVSRPDQPALLLIPSGGVRVDRENGLLTTAMWAPVWPAISSSRARTSGLIVGLVVGESRMSERGTLMADRLCSSRLRHGHVICRCENSRGLDNP